MSTNYFTDKHALDIPWIESPFFYDILEKDTTLTPEQKEMCVQYHEKGYLIVDTKLTDEEIDSTVKDMYAALGDDSTKYHADHYLF